MLVTGLTCPIEGYSLPFRSIRIQLLAFCFSSKKESNDWCVGGSDDWFDLDGRTPKVREALSEVGGLIYERAD